MSSLMKTYISETEWQSYLQRPS